MLLNILLILMLMLALFANSFKADISPPVMPVNRRNLVSSCKKYQQTVVNAHAVFEGYGLPTKSAVITSVVDFISSDTKVASIDGNTVYGESVGSATISIATAEMPDNSSSVVITTDSVEVTDIPTKILSLSVSAVTGVDSIAPSAQDLLSDSNSVKALFSVKQDLRKANDTANIAVYANFDDGHYMDVTHMATVTSLNENISVSAHNPNCGAAAPVPGDETSRLIVLPSLQTSLDGYWLQAKLDTCCDVEPCRQVTGLGRVVVNLETPTPEPTPEPTTSPSSNVTSTVPSFAPTPNPSAAPTSIPSRLPTSFPSSAAPTSAPSAATSRSSVPTYIPTTLPPPSYAPVAVPTSSPVGTATPTVSATPAPSALEEALSFVHLLHPKFSSTMAVVDAVSSSSVGSAAARPTHDYPAVASRSKWTMPFNMLPGSDAASSMSVQLTIGNKLKGVYTFGKDVLNQARGTSSGKVLSSLKAVLRSGPELHYSVSEPLTSRTVDVMYQVSDQHGSSAGAVAAMLQDGLAVRLVVNATVLVLGLPVSTSAHFDCFSPDAVSGVGECDGVLPLEWFSGQGDVAVSVAVEAVPLSLLAAAGGAVVTSSPVGLTLTKLPTHATVPASEATVSLQLPTAPVVIPRGLAEQRFTAPLVASTAGNVLTSWATEVTYDNSLMELVSVSGSSLYIDPVLVVAHNGTTSKVFMSSSGPKTGVVDAQLVGNEISIAFITFTVRSPLPDSGNPTGAPRLFTDALSLWVVDLVNVYSLVFSSNKDGRVTDHRSGGPFTTAELLVVDANEELPVAIFAYPTGGSNDLMNNAGLSATVPVAQAPVTVLAIYSSFGGSVVGLGGNLLVDVTSSSACNVDSDLGSNRGALQNHPSNGCVAQVPRSCIQGSSTAHMDVALSTGATSYLSALVPFRVWCPSRLLIAVDDNVLNSIGVPGRRPGGQANVREGAGTTTSSSRKLLLDTAAGAAAAAATVANEDMLQVKSNAPVCNMTKVEADGSASDQEVLFQTLYYHEAQSPLGSTPSLN